MRFLRLGAWSAVVARDLVEVIGVTYSFSCLEILELSRRDRCKEVLFVMVVDEFWSVSAGVKSSCVRLARTHKATMKISRLHFFHIFRPQLQ